MKLKRLIILMLIFICTICTFGCKNADSVVDNTVITVNGVSISLEEAKFYAYNKQANYEVYYLASGYDIEWDSVYDKEVSDMTLEELVKKEAIEEIKESVLVSEYARKQGITLNDNDKEAIEDSVNSYISDSSDKLLKKTGEHKDILTDIYTRKTYIDKLYEKLEITTDADAQDDLYKELIVDAEIKVDDELWTEITFEDAIFTKDDVEAYSE